MKAVVMAGGEGTRLRPLTCTVPKPMIKLLGKPVLSYIIDLLEKNGFDEIAITSRYRSEDIESYVENLDTDTKIYCIEEAKVLGTAGSVKNAAKDWDEPFVVISGDCICDIELSKVMLYHKSIMADITIVCSTVEEPGEYGTVNLTRSGSVDNFCEKPDWSHAGSNLANTGIYVINPAVLDMIPDNVQYDFAAHLFPDMMQEGKRLFGYQTTNYWCDIGDIKSLRMCVRDLMAHKVNVSVPECKNGIFSKDRIPEGDYSVVPPVYFGKKVHIGMNSVIGPYTVLEDNVSVSDNSRIKKSIIGSNSDIGGNCDLIGTVTGDKSVIKSNTVCLEGSCVGDGCIVNCGSTVSNNVLVWPGKHIPYRSVLINNLRDGQNEYDLLDNDGISGVTFSEMSCERCCRLGEALASSSCGGKVGIGYDGSKASKALAMAVLSGLISGGSVISDFGECFQSQMSFFVSFCSLDSGIYISATPKKTEIRLFGAYGLPLSRKYESELESRYKRSDFRRCSGVECNEIRDMSSVSEIYEGHLLSSAGDSISGAFAKITSPNPMIREAANKCFFLLGCIPGEKPEFAIDYSGKDISARDEEGNFVANEKLIMIAALNEFENGRDVCIPFDAPACIDEIADRYGVSVYRVGRSPMTDFGEDVTNCARRNLWAFDGLSMAFKIMGIMQKRKTTLSKLLSEIPDINIVRRTVVAGIPRYRIAQLLDAAVGKDTQGIRKITEKGTVTVTQTGAGRLIRIIAEAETMEAAKEICDFAEKKINGDTIDIYHQ